jgi:hypothetical protein
VTGVDFKLFNHLETPDAENLSDAVILFCENMYDGIGDFEHLKTYISMLREQLHDKSYKIQTVVAVHRFTPANEEYQHLRNTRADYVENGLRQLSANGDIDSYIVLNAIKNDISDELAKHENEIEDYIKNGKAFFTISYKGVFNKFIYKLTQEGHHIIHCPQLASTNWNNQKIDSVFNIAGMGLPRSEKSMKDNDVGYGLPITPILDEASKSQSLHNLLTDTEMGTALLTHMLGGEENTQTNVDEYFHTHAIIPGYPQTKIAAVNLIVVAALKNMNNKNVLNQSVDIFLPKGIIDYPFLAETMSQLAPLVPFEIITPQNTVKSAPERKLRIFLGFRLDDKHYSQLFSARNDLGMGSGDNSIIKVISSDMLPLFQDKVGTIRKFYVYQLIHLIDNIILTENSNQNKDDSLVSSLLLLKKYLQNISKFVRAGPDGDVNNTGLFNVQNEPDGSDEFDFKELREHSDQYHQYLKELAALAANDKVQTAWKKVSTHIQEHYNYRDNFRGIINGALLHNNSSLMLNLKDGSELNFKDWYNQLISPTVKSNQALLDIETIIKPQKQTVKPKSGR